MAKGDKGGKRGETRALPEKGPFKLYKFGGTQVKWESRSEDGVKRE